MTEPDERIASLLKQLRDAPEHKFSDWPDPQVPAIAAGVYTIWHGSRLVYVGMSGRGMRANEPQAPDEPKKPKGLFTRLNSHANGKRSGDQFCVYVCDHLIIPSLTPDEQHQIGMFELSLDDRTQEHIAKNFTYRYVIVNDGKEALALEKHIQEHGIGMSKKPYLNPIPSHCKRKR